MLDFISYLKNELKVAQNELRYIKNELTIPEITQKLNRYNISCIVMFYFIIILLFLSPLLITFHF